MVNYYYFNYVIGIGYFLLEILKNGQKGKRAI